MTTQERLESSVRELAKIDARRQSATNTRDWTSLEGKIIRRELDEAEGKWLANSKTTAHRAKAIVAFGEEWRNMNDAIMLCDFCSGSIPAWRYPAGASSLTARRISQARVVGDLGCVRVLPRSDRGQRRAGPGTALTG